jgi:hypothetical protein
MSERENGELPLAERAARSRISADVWEQIKTAYASGIGLRELGRNMGVPAGTVLARAKREGWSKQIRDAKSLAKRDDTPSLTPMEAVAVTLSERKDKTKLHLSRYAVEASENAANHRQNLKIARQVRDVAAVADSVWPQEAEEGPGLLVNVAILGIDPATVQVRSTDAEGWLRALWKCLAFNKEVGRRLVAPRNHLQSTDAINIVIFPRSDLTPAEFFTVVFYGLKTFCCKAAQICATRWESWMTEMPSIGNDVQCSESTRKNSFLNYKSAALDQLSYAGAAPYQSRF